MPAADLLIVENGMGVENANSYVTLYAFVAYCTLYDYSEILELSEEAQVAALVKACDLLQTYKYRGVQTYTQQGLAFPRLECFPRGASLPIPFDKVPTPVKRAQMAAAISSAQGINLQPNIDPGGFVIKEKVGPIETEYANGMSNGLTMPIFTAVDAMLADYLQYGGSGRYALKTLRV